MKRPLTLVPMTAAQEGIWIQNSLGASAAYNVPFAFLLRDDVDIPLLEASVNEAIMEFPALCSVIQQSESGDLQQV